MADLELQGVIKLTADNTEAKKKVKEVEDSSGKAAVSPASKPDADAKAFAQQWSQIASSLKDTFSRLTGGAFTDVINKVGGSVKALMAGRGGQTSGEGGDSALMGTAATGEGGAEGAMAAGGSIAGPIGIAVAGTLAAIVAVGMAMKSAIESVLSFGRSLADVSPSMASAFAQFDVKIMELKRQLGEALAPAFQDLMNALLQLAHDVLPGVIAIFQVLLAGLTDWVRGFDVILGWIEDQMSKIYGYTVGAALDPFLAYTGGVSAGASATATSANAGAHANGAISRPVDALGAAMSELKGLIKDYTQWRKDEEASKIKPIPKVMGDFMREVNRDGSPQRKFQDQQRNRQNKSITDYGFSIPKPRAPQMDQ